VSACNDGRWCTSRELVRCSSSPSQQIRLRASPHGGAARHECRRDGCGPYAGWRMCLRPGLRLEATMRTGALPHCSGKRASDHGAVDIVPPAIRVDGRVAGIVDNRCPSVQRAWSSSTPQAARRTQDARRVADRGPAAGDGVEDVVQSQPERRTPRRGRRVAEPARRCRPRRRRRPRSEWVRRPLSDAADATGRGEVEAGRGRFADQGLEEAFAETPGGAGTESCAQCSGLSDVAAVARTDR
jgi:hypothetical protein